MTDAKLAQNLMLSMLGIPYKLGAENNPKKYHIPDFLPPTTDCSETLQLILTQLGYSSIGDGAAWQWDKCIRWGGAEKKWPFMGVGVLFNNPSRHNNVGHIFLNAGKTRFGTIYTFESRGNRYGGTRLTRMKDMRNIKLRGRSALGTYPPLVIEGKPDTLFAWRGYNGPATKRVQTAVRNLGFRDAKGQRIVIDSEFGQRTQEAVRAFQQAHKLFPSGAVTGAVWQAMIRAL